MHSVKQPVMPADEAFIPASQNLPEITVRGTILAIILTIVLAAANAYLGLKVGFTVSASIPAAVISMGVLRFFRNSNVLENNIVQTAASAGEALTSGIAFTLPALIVIHYWAGFNYYISAAIGITGGIIGVLFSVPLRRVLLADKTLRFPEGTAIGKVLMASADKSIGLSELIAGSSIGAFISLCQIGLKLLADSVQVWVKAGTTIIGAGLGFAPAMLGAGYIVGIGVAGSIFLGVILGWLIGVPILAHFYTFPDTMSASDIANSVWKNHIRYVGIGTMIVGGLWAVCTLLKPMAQGIKASFVSVSQMRIDGTIQIPRTERDIKITNVTWCLLLLLCPLYFLFNHYTTQTVLALPFALQQIISGTGVILVMVLGFLLASICAYFAGLVGSSANPLSSMSLIALIVGSFVLSLLLDGHVHLNSVQPQSIAVAGIAIIITSVIASIASISNDTLQDLKAGHMVGATPWKQQVMLILGVVVAALVIPPILQLLFSAYGLGGVMPHPNMDPSQMLTAPQAGIMAAVVQGIFTHDVPWGMMAIGGVIAIVCLIIDRYFQIRFACRVPVLAVGIGIYLPFDTTMPLVIGGVLSWVVERSLKRRIHNPENLARAHQRGLLLASGLVAGSAVIGVILAIPFVIAGSSDVLNIAPAAWGPWAGVASIVVILALCIWIKYRTCRDSTL
jgi:putative OPT family oligopeptide transporter